MKNFISNSRGLGNLTFIFGMMTLMSLYLTATFAIALSQQRDYVRSTCIQEATDTQIVMLKNIRALFDLNPESTRLRLEITITEAELAIAMAYAPVLVPALQSRLTALKNLQIALDIWQKALLVKARIELQTRHIALLAKINSGQSKTASPWRFMLTMSSYFNPRFTPTLAVRPDSEGGVGPNYEWLEGAETKQNLAYSWNMYFKTSEQYQRFFTWVNVLSLQCSVAPDLRGKKWGLTINGDK